MLFSTVRCRSAPRLVWWLLPLCLMVLLMTQTPAEAARKSKAAQTAAAVTPDEDRLDFFNFTGPYFLGFYAELLIIAVFGGWLIRQRYRRPGDPIPIEELNLHPYEVAYLAGKEKLAINASLAHLVHAGALQADAGEHKVKAVAELPPGSHELDQELYGQTAGRGQEIKQLHQKGPGALLALRDRLQELGLLVSKGDNWRGCMIPAMPLLLLGAMGLIKMCIGIGRGKPVGLLILLLVATVVLLVLFAIPLHRSRRGDQVLADLKKQNAALKFAASTEPSTLAGPDMGLAVGLFGIGMLTMGPLSDLRAAIRPPAASGSCGSGSSCGSGCGSGCGGGGCGGGGCGGCGG